MKAMMFKRGFGDETKWKEVCAELGLPEDTEQVELSVSATKVRTSQNRSWEATDEEMSRNLGTPRLVFLALREHLQNEHSRFLWRRRFLFRCSRHNAAWIRRGGWTADGL